MEAHLKTGGEEKEIVNRAAASALHPDLLNAFHQFKIRHTNRYLMLKISDDCVNVDIASAKTCTFQDLKEALPRNDCRYVLYDHEFSSHDGRKTGRLYFISWLPDNATPYNKMAYTHHKGMVRDELQGLTDIMATNMDDVEIGLGLKQREESDDSDIDL